MTILPETQRIKETGDYAPNIVPLLRDAVEDGRTNAASIINATTQASSPDETDMIPQQSSDVSEASRGQQWATAVLEQIAPQALRNAAAGAVARGEETASIEVYFYHGEMLMTR
jgi:hypothetical protein